MIADKRRIAVALAGFAAFLNLYAPQSVLPVLARELSASPANISMTITASTMAVALIAPFVGAVSDLVGRQRMIIAAMFALVIPAVMIALSHDIQTLIIWRFVQGLALPPVFAVTVAYIGQEWPPVEGVGVTGIYMSAASLGGFCGRLVTGIIADLSNWHSAFLALAVLTLLLAAGTAVLLPKERHISHFPGLAASGRQMLRHLRNPQLIAVYAVGFGVLFTFVATFTYINFKLALPPFNLSPTILGSIFVVYVAGSAITPFTGRVVARFGRRALVLGAIGAAIFGILLTLVSSLIVIVIGLAIIAMGGFLSQTVSTNFVAVIAKEGTASAVGLYVTCYYIGGSVGGALPGLAWTLAGWPGCVAVIVVAMILMMAIVARFWREKPVII